MELEIETFCIYLIREQWSVPQAKIDGRHTKTAKLSKLLVRA